MEGVRDIPLFYCCFFFFFFLFIVVATSGERVSTPSTSFDYKDAVSKSLLYFEAQRSDHLPYNQRAIWRGHSGLTDGLEQGWDYFLPVDLVGGYHDAGDHVKFSLPMAFTITMLSWGVIEYGDHLVAAGEYEHALEAIKWGTDYFIKAHPSPHVLWAEVGDGETDHYCWQRPEDMTTPRRAYKIDAQNSGSEIAGETAAAMAAATIVFNQTDPHYSQLLIQHAQQLFEFGDKYRGRYDLSIGVVKGYYPSMSGYRDELLWAALWLHRATARHEYLEYMADNAYKLGGAGWAVAEFSWDIKYSGVQVLASKYRWYNILKNEGSFEKHNIIEEDEKMASDPMNEQESIRRSMRRAAKKINSYKEVPLNIKMRRPEQIAGLNKKTPECLRDFNIIQKLGFL